jgi:hypothetical protein
MQIVRNFIIPSNDGHYISTNSFNRCPSVEEPRGDIQKIYKSIRSLATTIPSPNIHLHVDEKDIVTLQNTIRSLYVEVPYSYKILNMSLDLLMSLSKDTLDLIVQNFSRIVIHYELSELMIVPNKEQSDRLFDLAFSSELVVRIIYNPSLDVDLEKVFVYFNTLKMYYEILLSFDSSITFDYFINKNFTRYEGRFLPPEVIALQLFYEKAYSLTTLLATRASSWTLQLMNEPLIEFNDMSLGLNSAIHVARFYDYYFREAEQSIYKAINMKKVQFLPFLESLENEEYVKLLNYYKYYL